MVFRVDANLRDVKDIYTTFGHSAKKLIYIHSRKVYKFEYISVANLIQMKMSIDTRSNTVTSYKL